MPLIRALARSDVDQLFAIEQAATAYPWSRRQFVDGLAGGEFGWGLEIDGELGAFAIFNHVLDEATLLDIAVRPACQRRGFARQLLRTALEELRIRDIKRCLLEVSASNAAAIALYREFEFSEDGVRRAYYPAVSGREDALLMSRILSE